VSGSPAHRERVDSVVSVAGELVDSALGDVERIDDVAELEHLALCLHWPFDLPGADADLAAGLVESIERRSDELGAGLLTALAMFSHQPLAQHASNAVARLSGRGVVSPLANRIGTLRVVNASCHQVPDGEVILFTLRRPRERCAQLGIVALASLECGDVIEKVDVLPPVRPSRVRKVLRAHYLGIEPQRLAPGAVLERLRLAAQHMTDHAIDLDETSATWLPAIARALTGRADSLPQLWIARHSAAPHGGSRRSRRTRTKGHQARAARKRNRR
jgi:hypothetical protein